MIFTISVYGHIIDKIDRNITIFLLSMSRFRIFYRCLTMQADFITTLASYSFLPVKHS